MAVEITGIHTLPRVGVSVVIPSMDFANDVEGTFVLQNPDINFEQVFQFGGTFWSVAHQTRLTIPSTGLWLVGVSEIGASNTIEFGNMLATINGGGGDRAWFIGIPTRFLGAGDYAVEIFGTSAPVFLLAGDFIEFRLSYHHAVNNPVQFGGGFGFAVKIGG